MTKIPERNPAAECRSVLPHALGGAATVRQCTYHASGGTDAWCSATVTERYSPTRAEKTAGAVAAAERVLENIARRRDERIDKAIDDFAVRITRGADVTPTGPLPVTVSATPAAPILSSPEAVASRMPYGDPRLPGVIQFVRDVARRPCEFLRIGASVTSCLREACLPCMARRVLA